MVETLPVSGNIGGDPNGAPDREVVIECKANACPLSEGQYVNACAPGTNKGEGGDDRHILRIGTAAGWRIKRPPGYLGRGTITNKPELVADEIALVIDETADP